MLQLPKLAPGVPAILAPRATQNRPALLARAALHAGIVKPEHINRRGAVDYNKVVANALRDWLVRSLTGAKRILPAIDITLLNGPCTDACDPDDMKARAVIDVYGLCADGFEFPVGPELERLESLHPGLGATVLKSIDTAAWRTMPIFTPSFILDTARQLFWGGYDDETEYLEEFCESPEERADIGASMCTRAMFSQTFPAWALGGSPRLSGRALERLGRETRDERARAVIRDVLALRKLRLDATRQWDRLPEGEFIGHCAALTWGKADHLTLRIIDDFHQQAGQGEFHEQCGRFLIPLDRVPALKEWMVSMRAWTQAVVILDRLLGQLAAAR